jgi:formate dehydrogenase subunit gamma
MYVLHHADRPGLYNGLAANPGIGPSVSLWKGFLKPVASFALGAAALGTFFHYMAAGPLAVREEAVSDREDLVRHTARERLNHWLVALCFVLAVFSGFAFFHPAFFPLSQLFGGGPWSRILHPFLGAVLILSFASMFSHFRALNRMTPADWEWVKRLPSMMGGDDRDMPAQGKYNGGQKILFQAISVCLLVMVATGIVMWRAYFTFPVTLVRISAVLHAAGAVVMAGLIMAHVYAAVWTKGTFRAMIRGTVTRAWAKQHHKAWYDEMTKD